MTADTAYDPAHDTAPAPDPALTPGTADVARMRALARRQPRPSERIRALRPVAVGVHRAQRRVRWLTSGADWARDRHSGDLPVRVQAHNSLLMRRLGDWEQRTADLQRNKVTNLRLASAQVDGLLIGPGQTFSFNRVVGNCTRRRGYLPGMRLSYGQAVSGVGGGLCQLANLIHWLVLHSALTVTERSEHSFDPFPDNGRVLPWGTGCSIVYNYLDLVVRNDTASTFQLRVKVGERYLEGELRADAEQPYSYSVYARNERFYRLGPDVFRANEIWRSVIDRHTGSRVREEPLRRNCALVKYPPTGVELVELPDDDHPAA